ncbi:hypothetical protein FHS40_005871 [Streptomyces spectabilis]|uniref:Uncharacterized protein n=1 Tax=Streptomyces spectabilis TaxID=68270 RepID=A0A7W8AY74_STRST|nr:hypothetical protein [Streptomyces spectabilis]
MGSACPPWPGSRPLTPVPSPPRPPTAGSNLAPTRNTGHSDSASPRPVHPHTRPGQSRPQGTGPTTALRALGTLPLGARARRAAAAALRQGAVSPRPGTVQPRALPGTQRPRSMCPGAPASLGSQGAGRHRRRPEPGHARTAWRGPATRPRQGTPVHGTPSAAPPARASVRLHAPGTAPPGKPQGSSRSAPSPAPPGARPQRQRPNPSRAQRAWRCPATRPRRAPFARPRRGAPLPLPQRRCPPRLRKARPEVPLGGGGGGGTIPGMRSEAQAWVVAGSGTTPARGARLGLGVLPLGPVSQRAVPHVTPAQLSSGSCPSGAGGGAVPGCGMRLTPGARVGLLSA